MKKSKFDSNFKKKKNDFYRTVDDNAFYALDNIIPAGTKFTEPCAGYGDLVEGFENLGHRCTYASDLVIRRKTPDYINYLNAFDLKPKHVRKSDFIITNPPFTRSVLHEMIRYFVTLKPTWLLFEADWMHTKQSIDLMNDYGQTVVSVGRLKWFKNTKSKSLKDFSWYLFTDKKRNPIKFIPPVRF